ncbi:unnamed protein product [Rotaria sp. Silwood1]|nr:unnamed protein product [Rotaria sp. Silwood1]
MATSSDLTGISTTNETASSNNNYASVDVDLDQRTQEQQNEIEKEVADHQPLISAKIETSELKNEYLSEDKIYQDKELMKKYKYLRRTRGDGNCFYRAFGFGYLEKNLNNKNELERFRQLTRDLKNKLVQLGYLDFTVEDVNDVVLEVIDNVYKGGSETTLMESFCSPAYSDYFVAYLR